MSFEQLSHQARRIPARLKQWGLRRTVHVACRSIIDMAGYRAWDLWHGIETSKLVGLPALDYRGECYGNNPEEYVYSGWNGDYTPASWKFPERLKRLNLDWNSFVYIDLGSGKGKSLFMAAELPFRKVIGVELSPVLVEVARRNLKTQRHFDLKCKDIEIVLQDATKYEFPPEPLVIYMLNSFPPPITKIVLDNLRQSLAQNPREIYFIYTPVPPPVEKLFSEYDFFEVVDSSAGHKTFRAGIPYAGGRARTDPTHLSPTRQ